MGTQLVLLWNIFTCRNIKLTYLCTMEDHFFILWPNYRNRVHLGHSDNYLCSAEFKAIPLHDKLYRKTLYAFIPISLFPIIIFTLDSQKVHAVWSIYFQLIYLLNMGINMFFVREIAWFQSQNREVIRLWSSNLYLMYYRNLNALLLYVASSGVSAFTQAAWSSNPLTDRS